MKFDYARMAKTADRLFDRFSESTISVTRGSGSYVDGEYVAGANTPFDVTGVVVPYDESQINNTTILAGDLQVKFKRDFEPQNSDIFVIDGDSYEVVAIRKYKPSDTVLAYWVQLRK